MNGLQLINRRVIIDYIKQLLNIDMQYAPFQIVKTEETVSMSMPPTGCLQRSILLSGQIDRIDKRDGKLRVVDYKTGHKMVNNMPSVHDIFTGEMVGDHSDYFFQSMLYSVILREDKQRNPMVLPVSPALLYIQHSRADNYDPIIKIADEPIDDIHKYQDEFMKELEALLADIFDPAKPFSPTDEHKRCQTCPYKKLCN
jgi:ATP-dependent helicase/DNAse subunit B